MHYLPSLNRPHTLALTILAAVLLSLAGIATTTETANAEALSQAKKNESRCIVDTVRRVSPGFILRGETATVRLNATIHCPKSHPALHIALVLDASASMAGAPSAEMKDAVKRFIVGLDLEKEPGRRVGIVQFNSSAKVHCELTNDTAEAEICVDAVDATGGNAMDLGINEAVQLIRKGRALAEQTNPNEVIIVLGGSPHDEGCPPVVRAAGSAKGQGILVVAVCIGPDCDPTCLRQTASSSRYFFDVSSDGDLADVLAEISDIMNRIDETRPTWKQLIISEHIPEHIKLVEGTISEGGVFNAGDREIQWRNNFPGDTVTMTYKIRPLISGFLETNDPSFLKYRDSQNRSGEKSLPVGKILVLGR